ncbi:hypothetical protein K440DRAFT_644112 [Wilcoxina mikolae CBS 423.85]|nr:hypothetical protein K440DRAFT_644112 [Wilcoxina mikolae CBS 423.85]
MSNPVELIDGTYSDTRREHSNRCDSLLPRFRCFFSDKSGAIKQIKRTYSDTRRGYGSRTTHQRDEFETHLARVPVLDPKNGVIVPHTETDTQCVVRITLTTTTRWKPFENAYGMGLGDLGGNVVQIHNEKTMESAVESAGYLIWDRPPGDTYDTEICTDTDTTGSSSSAWDERMTMIRDDDDGNDDASTSCSGNFDGEYRRARHVYAHTTTRYRQIDTTPPIGTMPTERRNGGGGRKHAEREGDQMWMLSGLRTDCEDLGDLGRTWSTNFDRDYRRDGNFIHFDTDRSTRYQPIDGMAAQEAEHGSGRVRELSQDGVVLREHKAEHVLGDQIRLLSGL